LKQIIMKKTLLFTYTAVLLAASSAVAQDLRASEVPANVKASFMKKYPDAKKVNWEKENGNFEANWGGRSHEDSSTSFTPAGEFIEIVLAIPVSQLPKAVAVYVKEHYNGSAIKEAGKVTDAKGAISYEAEIKGKDLIFDERGNFIKED